jgi:hypothetical protein
MTIEELIEATEENSRQTKIAEEQAHVARQQAKIQNSMDRIRRDMGEVWETLAPYGLDKLTTYGEMYGKHFVNMDDLQLANITVYASYMAAPRLIVLYEVNTVKQYSIGQALVAARRHWQHLQQQKKEKQKRANATHLGVALQRLRNQHFSGALEALDSILEESEVVSKVRGMVEEQRSVYEEQRSAYVAQCRLWRGEVASVIAHNKAWLEEQQTAPLMPALSGAYQIQRIGYAVYGEDEEGREIQSEWVLYPREEEYWSVLHRGEIVKRSFPRIVYIDKPRSVTPLTAPADAVRIICFHYPFRGQTVTVPVAIHPAAEVARIRWLLEQGVLSLPKAPAIPENCVIGEDELCKIEQGYYEEEE